MITFARRVMNELKMFHVIPRKDNRKWRRTCRHWKDICIDRTADVKPTVSKRKRAAVAKSASPLISVSDDTDSDAQSSPDTEEKPNQKQARISKPTQV